MQHSAFEKIFVLRPHALVDFQTVCKMHMLLNVYAQLIDLMPKNDNPNFWTGNVSSSAKPVVRFIENPAGLLERRFQYYKLVLRFNENPAGLVPFQY